VEFDPRFVIINFDSATQRRTIKDSGRRLAGDRGRHLRPRLVAVIAGGVAAAV
jgi:hypothetical protein